jgi:hypothetical protein
MDKLCEFAQARGVKMTILTGLLPPPGKLPTCRELGHHQHFELFAHRPFVALRNHRQQRETGR